MIVAIVVGQKIVNQNFILSLADGSVLNALDGGDYSKYEILKNKKNRNSLFDVFFMETKTLAEAQLFKVQSSYLLSKYHVKGFPLLVGNQEQTREIENLKEASELWSTYAQIKRDSYWRTRAKAFLLLSEIDYDLIKQAEDAGYDINSEKVFGKIIDFIGTDQSLVVRKTALDTFRDLTNFQEEPEKKIDNIFDFKRAKKCWEKETP